jgi:hypothetical protein
MIRYLKIFISFALISIAIGITIWCFLLKSSYQVERLVREDSLFQERVVVEKAQERLSRIKNEIDGLSKSIDNLVQRAASLESEAFSHKQELDIAKSQLIRLNNHNLSVRHQIEQANANIINIQSRLEYFTKETLKVDERLELLLKTKDALIRQLEQYIKTPAQPTAAVRSTQDQDIYSTMQEEEFYEGDFLAGEVLTVNREFAFLVVNLGQSSGIKEGMILTIQRDNRNLAQAKVETVRERISAAALIDKENLSQIRAGDKALTGQYTKNHAQPAATGRSTQAQHQDSRRTTQGKAFYEGDFLAGEVLTVNSEFAFLVVNLGQSSGIKEGMILTIQRDNRNLAQAKVETVRDYISVALFIDSADVPVVKTGDKVIVASGTQYTKN